MSINHVNGAGRGQAEARFVRLKNECIALSRVQGKALPTHLKLRERNKELAEAAQTLGNAAAAAHACSMAGRHGIIAACNILPDNREEGLRLIEEGLALKESAATVFARQKDVFPFVYEVDEIGRRLCDAADACAVTGLRENALKYFKLAAQKREESCREFTRICGAETNPAQQEKFRRLSAFAKSYAGSAHIRAGKMLLYPSMQVTPEAQEHLETGARQKEEAYHELVSVGELFQAALTLSFSADAFFMLEEARIKSGGAAGEHSMEVLFAALGRKDQGIRKMEEAMGAGETEKKKALLRELDIAGMMRSFIGKVLLERGEVERGLALMEEGAGQKEKAAALLEGSPQLCLDRAKMFAAAARAYYNIAGKDWATSAKKIDLLRKSAGLAGRAAEAFAELGSRRDEVKWLNLARFNLLAACNKANEAGDYAKLREMTGQFLEVVTREREARFKLLEGEAEEQKKRVHLREMAMALSIAGNVQIMLADGLYCIGAREASLVFYDEGVEKKRAAAREFSSFDRRNEGREMSFAASALIRVGRLEEGAELKREAVPVFLEAQDPLEAYINAFTAGKKYFMASQRKGDDRELLEKARECFSEALRILGVYRIDNAAKREEDAKRLLDLVEKVLSKVPVV